jgi:hypothetical protein
LAPPNWKENFRTNTTRIGFRLQLSRPMLEYLCAVSDDVSWDRRRYGSLFYPECTLATSHALEKRGLIERKRGRESKKQAKNLALDRFQFLQWWSLTPVGEAVVNMLKLGGLFIPAEAAAEKFNERRGQK